MRKRIVMLVLSLGLIASLAIGGCAPGAAPPPAEEEEAPPAEEEEEAPPAAPEEEAIKWRMTTIAGATSPWHYLIQPFADYVYEMSDGQIEITLYPVNELYPISEFLDSVSRGVSEMALASDAVASGIDPAFEAGMYWTGDPLPVEGWFIYTQYTDYPEIMRDLYSRYDIQWLEKCYFPEETFFSNVPIRKSSDFKGVKIRCSGMAESLFDKLGASPTYISGAEIYTAAQLGTIDAFEMGGFSTNWASGLHEVADYIIDPPIHCPNGGGSFIVNMDAWNSLTPGQQSILRRAAFECSLRFHLDMRNDDLRARQKTIDYGLEVCTIEDMDYVREMATEVWEDYGRKNDDCVRLLEEYYEVLGLYGLK